MKGQRLTEEGIVEKNKTELEDWKHFQAIYIGKTEKSYNEENTMGVSSL